MSLSTRVIAGLGAVVVVGAATVGGSIAYASGKNAPVSAHATFVAGDSSIQAEPFCYNDGKPLDETAQAKCQADFKAAKDAGSLPSIDVSATDRVGVGVDPGVADHGWFAITDGGQQGQATLANNRHLTTFSGLVPASGVLNQSGKTYATVVEADDKTGDILGVWYFQLTTKD